MKGQRKLILLLVLVAILVGVNVYRPSSTSTPETPLARARGGAARTARGGAATAIPDAELQVEQLAAPSSVRAADVRRNIFEYGARPVAPTSKVARAVEQPPGPPPPPPKPPLRFYGFAEGSRSGARRVLLTDGEGIFVAAEGETVAGRYRVLAVRDTSVEVEETASQRRWVVPLEQP